MSRCIDKKHGDRLHAYELGTLSEEDQAAFERHLIECPHCAGRVAAFSEVSRVITHDKDIHEFTRVLAEQENDATSLDQRGAREGNWSRKRWSLSLPLAAAILVIMLLVDWQIDIKPTNEAKAAESRMVVLYLANLEDPGDSQHLGDITTNLLITRLAESRTLQVTSCERLLAVGADLGYDKQVLHRAEIGLELAQKVNAKWILAGEIVRTEPSFVITSRLSDVATGDILGTQRVEGKPGDDVFDLIDRLSIEIRLDLPLPGPDQDERSLSLAEITTRSPEAYRHYLEGVEYKSRFSADRSIEEFRLALEYDSTLAMAYFYLASLEDPTLISQAMTFSDRVSLREKRHIECSYALTEGDTAGAIESMLELVEEYPLEAYAYWRLGRIYSLTGRPELAIDYFENAVTVDPGYREAYNDLAYAYDAIGKRDQSIMAISRYIEVAPGEANPYDTRGDLYAGNRQVDEAISSYAKALSIDSSFLISLGKLGGLYLLKRNYGQADSCFRVLTLKGSYSERAAGRRYLAVSALTQGRFLQTLLMFDSAISADTLDSEYESAAGNLLQKSLVLAELDRFDEATSTVAGSLRLVEGHSLCCEYLYRAFLIGYLEKQGDTAQTGQEMEALHALALEKDTALAFEWYAKGSVYFDDGNFEAALEAFGEAARLVDYPYFPFMLARTYLEIGSLEKAAELFEELVVNPPGARWAIILNTKVHYYLGITYEESHWLDRATREYETFLSFWEHADTNLPSMIDARTRLRAMTPN